MPMRASLVALVTVTGVMLNELKLTARARRPVPCGASGGYLGDTD
jgi:hypothetical protein